MNQTKPPILDLDNFWAYQVVVLADKIGRHTLSVAREHGGLNLSQWRVLAAVGEKPGRTSAQVVSVTPMDKGVVSRAVATLIENGLIEKTPDLIDKRRATLRLTAKGARIYERIADSLKTALSDLNVGSVDSQEFSKIVKGFIRQMPDASCPANSSD